MSNKKLMSNSIASQNSYSRIIYVKDMLGELRRVAENENAELLCYLIEMAYIEAGDVLVHFEKNSSSNVLSDHAS